MFGSLADAIGLREDAIELPDEARGADVLRVFAERYPQVAPLLERVSVAVNQEVVHSDQRIDPTDEIALLPPVSGGADVKVGLREQPSVDEAIAAVEATGAGGTAVFLGTVRDYSVAGPVSRLDYEAYEDMAVRVMRDIASEAVRKWGLAAVAILHGVGSKAVGEATMVVACAAAHRDEAFDACRYVVDEVKARVPVWKKEFGPWGERWVE